MLHKQKRWAIGFVVISALLGGCNDKIERTEKQETAITSQSVIPTIKQEASPAPSSSSAPSFTLDSSEQALLQIFLSSAIKAQTIAKELDLVLTEMQHNDEFIEAQESIETARQEILYIWNTVHNELHPRSEELQKEKTRYESVLMEYREGLTMQLQGMGNSDPNKVMEGMNRAKQAEQHLGKLVDMLKNYASK